ncbi:MAG: hypothetical protein Q4G43_10560 [Mobilicoccus sp.]|nr:hypothetical protein [Mobilicoccus sp.]
MDERGAVDRAGRLLRFLARGRTHEPVEPTPEHVLWWADLALPSVTVGGTPLVTVDDVTLPARPHLPPDLAPWISGDIDRPRARLRLRATAQVRTSGGRAERRRLIDDPRIRASFATWHAEWSDWAATVRELGPVADLRDRLDALTPDEHEELVLGVGLLTCRTAGTTVAEHVFTMPATIRRAEGQVQVHIDPRRIRVDLDMLPRPLQASTIAALEGEARRVAVDPLGDLRDALDPLVEALRAEYAEYADTADTAPPAAGARPVVSRSPALRRRGRRDTTGPRLRALAEQVEKSGRVPGGLRALVGADEEVADPPSTRGLVEAGGVSFCPEPLLTAEAAVVRHVSDQPCTVVQTAPGSERGLLLAALVTDLLAQGRRVLITGAGERASVRAHLPAGLHPLTCGIDEQPDIDRLTAALLARDDGGIDDVESALVDLGRHRQRLVDDLVAAREQATALHRWDGRAGTLAEWHARLRDRPTWLDDLVDEPSGGAPLRGDDALRLRALLARDDATDTDITDSSPALVAPDLSGLPDPGEFAALVARFEEASAQVGEEPDPEQPWWPALQRASAARRAEMGAIVGDMRDALAVADRFPAGWTDALVAQMLGGADRPWREPVEAIGAVAAQAVEALAAADAEVSFLEDVPDAGARARYLRDHLAAHGPLPIDDHGTPRPGVDVPPAVQAAWPLFRGVRVDGRPPTTPEQVDALLRELQARAALDELDLAWPPDTAILVDAPASERIAWHRSHLEDFGAIVDLADARARLGGLLADLGMPPVRDAAGVRTLADLLDAVDAHAAAERAGEPLTDAVVLLRARSAAHADLVGLRDAATALDVDAYTDRWEALARAAAGLQERRELHELSARLADAAPRLLSALRRRPDPSWDELLTEFEQAWSGAVDAAQVARVPTPPADTDALRMVEDSIRDLAGHLAELRAWEHATAIDDLPATVRLDLTLHAHLARRLADGGGNERQHRELDRLAHACRVAVPAWFVPWDRLDEAPGPFDVVIVDDASALEADLAVRTLAPRLVVLGDGTDSGRSPDARAERLAQRYLHDLPDLDVWCDSTRSFFDDTVRRTGHRLHVPDDARAIARGRPEGSSFAGRVHDALLEAGFAPTGTVDVGGTRLDVVCGNVGLVCEDDTWDGPTVYARDLLARRRLAAHGWTVHVMTRAAFEADPAGTLEHLRSTLLAAGVRPTVPDVATSPGRAHRRPASDRLAAQP